MKRQHKHQWLEQSIYVVIWLFIFLLPLISGYFAMEGGLEREKVFRVVRESWLGIFPFFLLFVLNNYTLVPSLFFKKKYGAYTASLTLLIGALCWFAPLHTKPPKNDQRADSHLRMEENVRDRILETREKTKEQAKNEGDTYWNDWDKPNAEPSSMEMDRSDRPDRGPGPRGPNVVSAFPPLINRYLIPFIIAFLMVGFNVAIKLFFKSFRDEEVLKGLEHQRLQSELQYLKYQLNPHFFMNTLNNIHALVDIDTEKAKGTIVELSKLMRYVLYEASHKTILLSREIQFLKNYITLMSLRYTDKVSIEMNLPAEVPEVQIPPLLFISFVENAFKHGVSYRSESFIHVVMELDYEANRLSFRCANSNNGSVDEQHHGIGLENVRKRLRLLFGNDYTLSISKEEQKFEVLLIIPLSE